jgi:50S ribosomal protein L16 3-hydroxylase
MMNLSQKTALLGNLSPTQFMKTVWQRQPRLVQQAIPNYAGAVTPAEVLKLCTRDDLESRLIIREGKSWHYETGPFSTKALKSLPTKNWTVLVQGINTVVPAAQILLEKFAFIPYARLDDVMVSLAAPGGGVGPHFDSYDVFLLQGQGRRRWKISEQTDLTLRDDVPLKILKKFVPEHDWVLNPGDMLYLPPKCAHDGVAVDQCLTFSIGFRSPSAIEIASAGLEYVLDEAIAREKFSVNTKPEQLPASQFPAQLPQIYVTRFQKTLNELRWSKDEASKLAGIYASTPKSHIVFPSPLFSTEFSEFKRALSSHVVMLHAATIALYDAQHMYVNGDALPRRDALLPLLDSRKLERNVKLDSTDLRLLHDWHSAGWIELVQIKQ